MTDPAEDRVERQSARRRAGSDIGLEGRRDRTLVHAIERQEGLEASLIREIRPPWNRKRGREWTRWFSTVDLVHH
jgi:hypothetical protein